MDHWLNVRVTGYAYWPSEETKIQFGGHELVLRPDTKETEKSVHINLRNVPDVQALTLINRFLSILSWCDGQAMQNEYGWSGNPVPVSVLRFPTKLGSSMPRGFGYPFYRQPESNPKAALALALYREAVTVNSVPFSFLSFFKILNVFWNDRKNKEGKNGLVEGIRTSLQKVDDKDALKRIQELTAVGVSDVPQYLYESGRCAVAHAFSDPVVDPDDVTDLRRLSSDIDIIRSIAEHLIEHELKVSRHIAG